MTDAPRPDVLAAIGRTPLIRLARASQETGCTILGKAEFLNPGLSVKDRAALFIVRDAEARYAVRYRQPRENPKRVVIEIAVRRVLGSHSLLD